MSFAGEWDVTIATPIGKQRVVFRIRDEGGAWRGVAEAPGESVDFVDVVAHGDARLCWTQHVTRPLRLTLRFDVTLENDGRSLRGTAKAGILPASKLTATRRG